MALSVKPEARIDPTNFHAPGHPFSARWSSLRHEGAPLPSSAFAEKSTSEVVGVLDGDMIEVLHDNHSERIRLNGIDCPEKGQAYDTKA